MRRLNGWDAAQLYGETSNMHMHTLKIALINANDVDSGEFVLDTFRRLFCRRLDQLEPLHFQLVDTPLKLHHPSWSEARTIDFDYHVQHLSVPEPGDRRQVDMLIGRIASTPLDRARPLWQVCIAEGLANDHVALISKVHHALADGVASANLMALAMDRPDRTSHGLAAEFSHAPPAPGYPSTSQLLSSAGRDRLRQVMELPALVKDTAAGIARLRRRTQERQQLSPRVRRSAPPPTFFNHPVSPIRTFASTSLPLAEIKETSKHLGVTINDMVLAIAAGALRELLLRYDGRAHSPVIGSIPVSTDMSPDRITGNALSGLFIPLPVHIDDPLERVTKARAASEIAKENYQLLGPDLPGRWLATLPPRVATAALRHLAERPKQNRLYNLPISNVPGPGVRGRIAGAAISEIYSVGPLVPGSGLNITVWSYVDQLNISILSDDKTFEDVHDATDAMVQAFAEIRRAAGLGS